MLASKLPVLQGRKKTMPSYRRSRLMFGLPCLSVLFLTLGTFPLAAQANQGAASPPQSAQESTKPTPQPTPAQSAHASGRRGTLDDRVKVLAKALDLSETQQAAVKRILLQRQAEIFRLRQDGSISGEERIGRLRALQDQTVLRIRAVLNEDQKQKYNPLALRDRTPPQDQKSIEDWLKETTPKPTPAQHQ